VKWRGRRGSSNVRDARSQRVVRGGSGGLAMIANLVIRMFGIKGILVLAIIGVVGWQMGLIDPMALTGGSRVEQVEYQPTAEEEELFEFVKVVLADTEDIWNRELARVGMQYQAPELVIYRDQYPTGCGVGSARAGPFYCPADKTIYIDLRFYNDLARQFDAPGDFAQAYVIAHEVGHHIQKLLGLTDKVSTMRGRPDYNEYSVRLELQADFLAGVWAHHNSRYLERGDIQEAMRAANQIGDDAIQSRTQGKVVPHAFTHGTSEQRMRWFDKGWESGRIEDGDTFEMPYREL
jgi:predicted metalloprotease